MTFSCLPLVRYEAVLLDHDIFVLGSNDVGQVYQVLLNRSEPLPVLGAFLST